MKFIIGVFLAVVPVSAAQAQPAPQEQAASAGFQAVKRYKIVPGDTLWSLAGRYYGDPRKWSRIHEANPEVVKDPHWIYPSGEIVIPDVTEEIKPSAAPVQETVPASGPVREEVDDAVAEAPEPAVSPETDVSTAPADVEPVIAAPAPLPPSGRTGIRVPDLSDEMPEDVKGGYPSMLTAAVPADWKEDGKVLSAREEDEGEGLAVKGETVKIKLKPDSFIMPGDILTAYRRGNKLKDKKTGEKALELQKLAVLKILSVAERDAVAVIVRMNSAVEAGDVVKKE